MIVAEVRAHASLRVMMFVLATRMRIVVAWYNLRLYVSYFLADTNDSVFRTYYVSRCLCLFGCCLELVFVSFASVMQSSAIGSHRIAM